MTTRRAAVAAFAAAMAMVLTGCGSGYDDEPAAKPGELTLMFGSSGEAETAAVKAAAKRFSDRTGTKVEVIPAQDLNQQLGQAFAGGTPPDVFYVGPDRFQQYAKGGSLHPYGDKLDGTDDFYPALRQTYTYDDKLYCAPKDFSTHALVINTDMWQQAGLTDADIPKTWDDLARVAKALTTPQHVGLAFNGDFNPIGSLLLAAGGWYLNEDNTKVTADTPENLRTLEFVKSNLVAKTFAFAKNLDSGWGGEALGKGKAAMTIEGNWITGALKADFPTVKWRAVELPAGPAGKGTTVFSNCWGVAAKSDNKDGAVEFVKFLASPAEEQAFATAFGATPPRESLGDWTAKEFPTMAAFTAGVAYARGPVPVPGFDSVLTDFNTGLEKLAAGTATPKQLLTQLQQNGQEVLPG